MKLNSLKKLSAAAILALGLVSPAAHAVTAGSGDVILGFRATGGTGATSNLVVKLGQASTLTGATSVTTITNISADLVATYGANWASRTDVKWGVIGATSSFSAVGGDPANTTYASKVRPSAGSAAAAWTAYTASTQSFITNKVNTARNGVSAGTAGSNANAAIEAASGTSSWSALQPGGALSDGISFGAYDPTIEGTPAQALDFFKMVPQVSVETAGSAVGTFTLGSDGAVTFVPAAAAATTLAAGGTISLNSTNVVIANGTSTGSITVTRTGGLAATSVTVTTTPGSATTPANYAAPVTSVSFGAGQTSATIALTGLANTAATTKKFTVAISAPTAGSLGSASSAVVRLQGTVADTTAPVVAITTPVAASIIAEPTTGGVAFAGTLGLLAAGDSTIDSVSISINGGAPIAATISTDKKKWTVSTTTGLVPQANSVTATATDLDGNTTTSAPRSFTYKVLRTLAITSANGSYTISPTVTGGKGIVGQSYTITAKANTAFFFSSFTGGGSPAAVITPGVTPNIGSFTFAEGNTVTINFVATPFTSDVVGLYNGIVKGSTSGTDTQGNAGLFTATVVLNTGAFTGKLNLDGVSAPIAGVFNNVSKTFTTPLVANGSVYSLTINDTATPRTITGTITQYKRTLAVAVLNVNATQGDATATGGPFYVAFSAPATPADLNADEYPHGNGNATITIGAKGVATVKGTLADGTVYTSTSTVLKTSNVIPVFASFASRTGSIVGNAAVAAPAVTGTGFRWFRSANASQYYPYGFANAGTTGLTVDIAAGNSAATGTLGANVTFSEGEFSGGSVTATVTAAKVVLDAVKHTFKGEYTNGAGKHIIGGINVGTAFYGYILSPLPTHTDGSGQGSLVTVVP